MHGVKKMNIMMSSSYQLTVSIKLTPDLRMALSMNSKTLSLLGALKSVDNLFFDVC